MYTSISDFFWTTSFWLPSHLTWEDTVKNGKSVMPSCWDLWTCLPVSILLYLIRCFWEEYIATPFGRLFKLQEKKRKMFDKNDVIDKIIHKYRSFSSDEITTLCVKETEWTMRQVQRYIRKSKKLNIPSQMTKFTEASWKFIFFFSVFCYGFWSLWGKDWATNPKLCWIGWPLNHSMPREIYWYYMVELGFYISTGISLCFDVKRKDFVEMIVHHIATIVLLIFSYCDNMYRMGALVLIVHDSCDVIMEAAKMAKYISYQRICDLFFGLFTLLWLLTRLIIFPFFILKCALFDAPQIVSRYGEKPHIYYVLNTMMCTLQILHIIWFYFILKILYGALVKGHVQKDSRSETELSDSSVENDSHLSNGINHNSHNGYINGKAKIISK